MEARCIFSGSTENLNTSMTVTLEDGKKVEVWISDDYVDQATPVAVKKAVTERDSERNAELAELQRKAAELGLSLVPEGHQAPPVQTTTPSPQAKPDATPATEEVLPATVLEDHVPTMGAQVVDGRTADKKLSVSTAMGNVPSGVSGAKSEYDIKTESEPSVDLREGEIAEIAKVKGRNGMETAIPVRRVGKTGETVVRVVDTGGDTGLQQRFKDMANDSIRDDSSHNFGRQGYQVRTISCTLCQGSGKAMGKDCPKCDGAGAIDI